MQQSGGSVAISGSDAAAAARQLLGKAKSQRPAFLFARDYTVADVLHDPQRAAQFTRQYLAQEAEFFAVARNRDTGLTYDGVNLDPRTGQLAEVRPHSAPSKECLDLGLLVKALEGDPRAAQVVGKGDVAAARATAIDILSKKIATYEDFYATHPGYDGFLPWFIQTPGEPGIRPTDDWDGDIPGLDNGEWVWAMLLSERVLRDQGCDALADRYGRFNKLLRHNAVEVFYDREAGKVRADVHIVDPKSADSAHETLHDTPGRMTYLTGEHGVHEGIMMALYVTLFGDGLPDGAADRIWSAIHMKRVENEHGSTWQAYWGSSHESWAYLFLPFRDLPAYRDLFRIREAIRTQNAVARGYPGFATSTSKPGATGWEGYLDGAGIEGIGSQAIRNNDIYAIYGAFPLLLELAGERDAKSGNAGLAWLLNMLHAPKAQGPLGSGESGTNDGTAIAPMKTIDGSFPIALAMMGGVAGEMGAMLREQGRYEPLMKIMTKLYDDAFGSAPLREPDPIVPPRAKVTPGLGDFVPALPRRADAPVEAKP